MLRGGATGTSIMSCLQMNSFIASKQLPTLTKRELIGYWSKHYLETLAGQEKLQKLKRDFDPNPKAIAGPSGQQAVYVDISSEE